MNTVIEVKAEYIKSLLLFASKKDVRYYLNGICLEIGASESRLIATDGHRAGVFRIESEQAAPMDNVVIPSESFAHVKKGAVTITIESEAAPRTNSREYTIECGGMTVKGISIDARYPDWRRILPESVNGEVAQFNASYLADLGKVYALLGGSRGGCPIIGHNGQSAASITMPDDNFTGVVMPIRHDAPLMGVPRWASAPLHVEQAVA